MPARDEVEPQEIRTRDLFAAGGVRELRCGELLLRRGRRGKDLEPLTIADLTQLAEALDRILGRPDVVATVEGIHQRLRRLERVQPSHKVGIEIARRAVKEELDRVRATRP